MTVMIDFFESKTFNAASVGALTMAVSYYSDVSTWATIGLALLAAGAFLLMFRKGRIELQNANRRSRIQPKNTDLSMGRGGADPKFSHSNQRCNNCTLSFPAKPT